MNNSLFNISLFTYDYTNPEFLWALLIIPLLVIYRFSRYHKISTINLSSTDNFKQDSLNFWEIMKNLNLALFMIGLVLIIFSIARPFDKNDIDEIRKKSIEGIDVVLAMDISTSMLEEDFYPNRLEVSKKMASNFIMERPNDRIGIVAFAGESFTQAPLTNDQSLLISLLAELKPNIVTDGTAIGSGLVTSINRLYKSESKSKVIILLTDGINNSGEVQPITAAKLAQEYGIIIYTIGVGRNRTKGDIEIDTRLLTEIAKIGNGNYYRAQNEDELAAIYTKIDKLEKSKLDDLEFKTNPPEKYYSFLFFGLILILFNYLLKNTIFKGI